MKVPRDLDGRVFADHLVRAWNYQEQRQTGSHIILRTASPSSQTLPVPAQKPLRTGTLSALLRLVAEHKQVTREDVLKGL